MRMSRYTLSYVHPTSLWLQLAAFGDNERQARRVDALPKRFGWILVDEPALVAPQACLDAILILQAMRTTAPCTHATRYAVG